jgi:hypothetical protein
MKILQQWAIGAPCIFYHEPYLYLSFRGTNNDQIYVCRTSDFGKTLDSLQTVPNQSTDYTPTLTLASTDLILAWRRTDSTHTINTMRANINSSDPMSFDNQDVYDETASGRVSLMTFNNQAYIGWSGNDAAHHLNIMALPLS